MAEGQDEREVSQPWIPSWRIRWTLKAKKWFPIFSQVATVVISLAALFVISMQTWIYEKTKAVIAEQTDIIRISQRSYVGVASLTAELKERQIILMFENVGRIPANKIKVEVREVRRIPGKPSHGSINPINYFEGQQLFPGSLKMQVVVPLTDFQLTEIDDIAAKKETLYISGTIEYDDGFGTQKTAFGFEYKPPPNEGWTARSELITKK